MNRDDIIILLTDGISAALGAQALIEGMCIIAERDPSNNDNYCRLVDWIKSARAATERIVKE